MIERNVVALGWVSFFTDMASAMVTSVLPVYVVRVLGEGVDKLGLIVAVATFVSYAFRIVFGYLSDRRRIVKPLVFAGYFLSAATKPVLALAGNWQQVAVLRGTERMGKAVRSAARDSLIAAYSRGKSGRSFGFHKMMDVAGEMSGALMAFAVLYLLGEGEKTFRLLFVLTALPGFISVLIVGVMVRDVPSGDRRYGKFEISADRKMLPILMIYFVYIFFIFNDSFLLLVASDSGISAAMIPLFAALYGGVQSLLSYLFGIRIDILGARKMLGAAMILGMAGTGALAMEWIVPAFVLMGASTVSGLNAMRAWISDTAQNRGTVYGLFYGGTAVSGALGAVISGMIWEQCSRETAILVSFVGVLFAGAVYLVYIKKLSSVSVG